MVNDLTPDILSVVNETRPNQKPLIEKNPVTK